MTSTDFKSFNYLENGEVSFSILDTIKTTKQLQSGSYKVQYIEQYPTNHLSLKQDLDCEQAKIHNFSDKEKIDNLVTAFFNKNVVDKVNSLNFYHKIGVLLYGIEGTGKSSIIKHYCERVIKEHNGLVFHILNNKMFFTKCWDFIQSVRKIQNNPIVVVMDEFDSFMDNLGVIKTILDGNLSITNCMFFASTNHIESIPEALKNRPSRFKYSINIEGIQSVEEINTIVSKLLNEIFNPEEISIFAKDLKGHTLDQIKQFCFDKIMNLDHYSTYSKKSTIGFSR